jgi:hypothetical protein
MDGIRKNGEKRKVYWNGDLWVVIRGCLDVWMLR